jgi:hypothetical protein
MSMPEEIKVLGEKIDCEVSEETFILGFKKWKESTSTSRSPARMHSSALMHVKYFVKMTHGILEGFYQVLCDFLLYSTGQGSGASPAVWLSIIMCMLTALTALASIAMCLLLILGVIFLKRGMLICLWMIRPTDVMMHIWR